MMIKSNQDSLVIRLLKAMDFEIARARLLKQLKEEIKDERVLKAMAHIPRELFVSKNLRSSAYEDRPLSIGMGQTISQPYIIALMSQELKLAGVEKVLEVGTGSGYQAAILAELAQKVVTVERIPTLAERARKTLKRMGYTNVEVHIARKNLGWKDGAPYDAVMVTAGAPSISYELLDQLAAGGRMVIPVGAYFEQELVKITKTNSGFIQENLGGCRFVPLIGEGAWKE